MGLMSKLNVMRMEGKSIARYERRLGLIESKPELHDYQKNMVADFIAAVDEGEPPVFEINRASDLDTMG